jgi:hypothetical protein
MEEWLLSGSSSGKAGTYNALQLKKIQIIHAQLLHANELLFAQQKQRGKILCYAYYL